MTAKKLLTRFGHQPEASPELLSLLDEAGLELWQASEGFWAIRLKSPQTSTSEQPARDARSAR